MMVNAPGTWNVLAQTREGCAILRGGLELEAPRLEPLDDELSSVRARSRPGDAFDVFYTDERRAVPGWDNPGPYWLGGDPQTIQGDWICGADGTVTIPLDGIVAEAETLFLQAIATPPGRHKRILGAFTPVLELPR